MAVEVRKLMAVVRIDISNFLTDSVKADNAFEQIGKTADAAGDKMAGGMEKGEKAAARLQKASAALHGDVLKLGGAFTGLSGIVGALSVGAALKGFKSLADSASDMNESLGKSQVVFKQSSGAIEAWANHAAQSIGQSKQEAIEAAGTFGNLFTSLGIGGPAAAQMSMALTNLASDLASFNNVKPEEALVALRAALRGESEPLTRFGVNLNDATLRAEALKIGLVKSTKEGLEPSTKAAAAYALILAQTKNAQGDFARTSGGLANQQRIAEAAFKDASAELGKNLLPIMLSATRTAADLTRQFNELPNATKVMGLEFVGLAAASGPIAQVLIRVGALTSSLYGLGTAAGMTGLAAAGTTAGVLAAGLAAAALAGRDLITVLETINERNAAREKYNALPELHKRVLELRDNASQYGDEISALQQYEKVPFNERLANQFGVKSGSALERAMQHAKIATTATNKEMENAIVTLTRYQAEVNLRADNLAKKYFDTVKDKKTGLIQPHPTAAGGAGGIDFASLLGQQTGANDAASKIQTLIDGLRERVGTFGDKSEYARVHFSLLHGELKNTPASLKSIAEGLARELDGLTKSTDAKKKAEEYTKRLTSAINEANKARELAMIPDGDAYAMRKRFQIEQKYADPKDRLNPADANKVLATLDKNDTENAEREGKKKLIDLHHKLEEAVQSLTTTNAAYIAGHEKLTHVEEAQSQIDNMHIAILDRYGNSLAKRMLAQAELADSNEAWAKSWDAAQAGGQKYLATLQSLSDEASGLVNAYKEASDTGTKYDTVVAKLTAKYRDLAAASLPWQKLLIFQQIQTAAQAAQDTETLRTTTRFKDALADVTERLAEATGHGDAYQKVLARMRLTSKELTPEQAGLARQIADATRQMEHLERRNREVGNITSRLSSPFRDAFDEMFQKGGKAGIQRFTQEMKSSLSGMFADLLGNQVHNLLTAALTPLYDELSAMLRSAVNSLQGALSGLHMSVNQIAATMYGMLAALGQQGKKRQGGAILGGILGGIAGSFLPGGWLLGAEIGSSLGGAVAGGNVGEIALAGINAAGAYSNVGGSAIDATQNNAGGTSHGSILNGRAVNVTTHFHGPINQASDADAIVRQISSGVRAGLRTAR